MRRGLVAFLVLTAACSSVPGSVCVSGTTAACTCSTGGAGVQTCNSEGSGYNACTCIATDAGGNGDAGTSTCAFHPGTWQTMSSVDSMTTHTGCPATVSMSQSVTSIEALVADLAGACPTGCTCTPTAATPPSCVASIIGTCSGISTGHSAQQINDTTVVGVIRFTFADGSVCAYDVTGTWVSP